MVNFKYYDPNQIFQDANALPEEMTGPCNRALAKSFIHSRNFDRGGEYDRNAGAVQLYCNNGIDIYQIPGFQNKEYHYVSYGNKYFKEDVDVGDNKATSYGHSERLLMREILDDLISAHNPDPHEIVRPSDHANPADFLYEVLKYLTNNARQYKEYLERKNIIVKMWSERPACNEESNQQIGGGNCNSFINDICPEGSQFGFIVQNYTRADNQEAGVPKVRDAFEAFKNAYAQAYP